MMKNQMNGNSLIDAITNRYLKRKSLYPLEILDIFDRYQLQFMIVNDEIWVGTSKFSDNAKTLRWVIKIIEEPKRLMIPSVRCGKWSVYNFDMMHWEMNISSDSIFFKSSIDEILKILETLFGIKVHTYGGKMEFIE